MTDSLPSNLVAYVRAGDCMEIAVEGDTVSRRYYLKSDADAEIERLNRWADGFSDAQLKERALAEARIKELEALLAKRAPETFTTPEIRTLTRELRGTGIDRPPHYTCVQAADLIERLTAPETPAPTDSLQTAVDNALSCLGGGRLTHTKCRMAFEALQAASGGTPVEPMAMVPLETYLALDAERVHWRRLALEKLAAKTEAVPGTGSETQPRNDGDAALRRVIARHVKWREIALGFLHQVIDGCSCEDEWPALAEFVEQSESRVTAQETP